MVSSYFERLPVQVVRKEDVIQHSDKHAPFAHTIFNVFLASNSWVYIAKNKNIVLLRNIGLTVYGLNGGQSENDVSYIFKHMMSAGLFVGTYSD